jgi:hypothetical protein
VYVATDVTWFVMVTAGAQAALFMGSASATPDSRVAAATDEIFMMIGTLED